MNCEHCCFFVIVRLMRDEIDDYDDNDEKIIPLKE